MNNLDEKTIEEIEDYFKLELAKRFGDNNFDFLTDKYKTYDHCILFASQARPESMGSDNMVMVLPGSEFKECKTLSDLEKVIKDNNEKAQNPYSIYHHWELNYFLFSYQLCFDTLNNKIEFNYTPLSDVSYGYPIFSGKRVKLYDLQNSKEKTDNFKKALKKFNKKWSSRYVQIDKQLIPYCAWPDWVAHSHWLRLMLFNVWDLNNPDWNLDKFKQELSILLDNFKKSEFKKDFISVLSYVALYGVFKFTNSNRK